MNRLMLQLEHSLHSIQTEENYYLDEEAGRGSGSWSAKDLGREVSQKRRQPNNSSTKTGSGPVAKMFPLAFQRMFPGRPLTTRDLRRAQWESVVVSKSG
jgi:hypothetical protein